MNDDHPKIFSWGRPLVGFHLDTEPLTATLWMWQSRQFLIHQIVHPSNQINQKQEYVGQQGRYRSPCRWHQKCFPYSLTTCFSPGEATLAMFDCFLVTHMPLYSFQECICSVSIQEYLFHDVSGHRGEADFLIFPRVIIFTLSKAWLWCFPFFHWAWTLPDCRDFSNTVLHLPVHSGLWDASLQVLQMVSDMIFFYNGQVFVVPAHALRFRGSTWTTMAIENWDK